MSDLASVHAWPTLERPMLVMALEGWIDSGAAAANAVSALLAGMPHEPFATFDADALIDYRARRPVLRISDGVSKGIRWPELQMQVATNRTGRSVVILSGPEPDMRWHAFVDEVLGLAARLGVELVVGLGAFPAPVPHTRPLRLTATATDPELAARVGFLPATVDVPSGVQGVLEHAFGKAGVPAVGLWARVPHYASAMPYPEASAVLLDELRRLGDLDLDTRALHQAGLATHRKIDELIAGSDEHAAMVRQLEAQHDDEVAAPGDDLGEIPSGDELAAELERFLRGER